MTEDCRVTAFGEFCAYDKAVQHLGDRWSLLIVRDLAIHGRLGFNSLADGLPGISRSVLVRRLRKLEDLGLIARDLAAPSRAAAPYRLAPAGEQLVPTLLSLKDWAQRWTPEDPTMVEQDPDVIMLWLAHRVDPRAVPDRQVVIAFDIRGQRPKDVWLILERDALPSFCFDDPRIALDRYVYVEAEATALYPISRGLRDWRAALADRSVTLYGEPELVRALPAWFHPAEGLPSPARRRNPVPRESPQRS
jgi:DNA-binding HxlR family transcriptional regulator